MTCKHSTGGACLACMWRFLPLAFALASCGGGNAATRTVYGAEVTRCIANERAIVDRSGTTLEQDRADLRAERERCDAALRSLEATAP